MKRALWLSLVTSIGSAAACAIFHENNKALLALPTTISPMLDGMQVVDEMSDA